MSEEIKVGLQLYSVRKHLAQNPIETLRNVIQCGYKYLEFANLNASVDPGCGFGVSKTDMQRLLREAGGTVASSHFWPLNENNYDRIVDYHSAIGTKYMISKVVQLVKSVDEGRRLADYYNSIAEKLQRNNMRLCFYARSVDEAFKLENGQSLLDVVMENTDPALVDLEIDIYWIYRWGHDPIDYMKKYGDRIKLAHQKDIPVQMKDQVEQLRNRVREGQDVNPLIESFYSSYLNKLELTSVITPDQFTEVGTGMMDIQGYITALRKYTNAEYLFLEQDYSSYDELESIRISMDAFKRFQGINWN